MKKTFNRAMSLVLAAAMALSLAACGGNQENNGSGGGTAGGYKNTLTWAQGADVTSLDPHQGKETPAVQVNTQIFDTLVTVDPETNEVVPQIAESWEQTDDQTYVFKIREGIKFHDGSDLTAEDVAPSQLHRGYTISVKDLLYGLMLESNNYYALYLAEYVGGDIQSFCDRMNQKALELGATNTHFMNPHGLDDPNHYSTAYDMYLIVKEVHNHQILRDIDGFDTYTYTFYDSNGVAIDTESTATNLFVTGEVSLPATFHLESWKTGTTDGAGNCLAMYLTKDGKDYVVVASSGNSKADLYNSIIRLLCLTD